MTRSFGAEGEDLYIDLADMHINVYNSNSNTIDTNNINNNNNNNINNLIDPDVVFGGKYKEFHIGLIATTCTLFLLLVIIIIMYIYKKKNKN